MSEPEKKPRTRSRKIINIIFVCSGNTCRSYLAEAIARHLLKTVYFKKNALLKDLVIIGSAGTSVLFTDIPSNSRRVLDVFEIPNISFKPKPIDDSIIKNSTLLITMSTSHKKNILANFIRADEKKIFNLIELSNIILYIQSEAIFKRKAVERGGVSQVNSIDLLKNIRSSLPTSIKPVLKEYFEKQETIDDAPGAESKAREEAARIVNARIRLIKNVRSEALVKPLSIDVEDPFGGSIDTYIQVAKIIKENIMIIFNYLFK